MLHCSCHYDLISCTLVFTNEQNIIQSKIGAKNGQNWTNIFSTKVETNSANDESNDNFLSTFINMHLIEDITFYVILLLVKWLIIELCSISQTAGQGQSLCRMLNHALRSKVSHAPLLARWGSLSNLNGFGVAKFWLQLFNLFVIFRTTFLRKKVWFAGTPLNNASKY